MNEPVLVLHNIRSVHNVGSLFRTADAAGVSRIILSGYTPGPTDRFGRERKDFSKVSLGAEKSMPWMRVGEIGAALTTLKRDGYIIAMIEQSTQSQNIFQWRPLADARLAVVLGNEVRGISPQTLKHADVILEIPMRGKKESLNVSVAAGIILFSSIRS